ncbi:DUF5336 domain-containing protein [Streptomyces sp. DT24]|uniref:DUF5336 domain-containing protein n=1 Tax=unclassified Streptomyces TaxID=2593676 RepID=UPI0023B8E79F|nr:DUF5336 domain-containing protein [Streptomyces sp. AM 4-1-1]WEH33149.1 DUF5336 domain-containing protein [Streptomyces sp. AM 4-1-1]
MVIGAAVVLFIASFLDYFSFEGLGDAPNAWDSLGNAIGVFMVGVIGAALIILTRSQSQPRKVLGLDLGVVGVAATVFTAWALFWTIIDLGQVDAGAGLILGLIAALVLAAGAVATPLVPALKAPLLGAPRPPAVQSAYGQPQPGQGYGYPGAQQQPYGAQPGQPQPYGAHPQQAARPEPQQAQTPAPQDSSAQSADFAPFWFAVPVTRPLYGEDGSAAPIAELAPGTWYLAVEQRGPALVAQTQDGRRGVLQDTTGIQRG